MAIIFDKAQSLAQAKAKREATLAANKEAEASQNHQSFSAVNGDLFPFTSLNKEAGEEVVVRFTPDPDEANDNFWRMLSCRRLPFVEYQQPDGTTMSPKDRFTVQVPAFNVNKNESTLYDLKQDYLFNSKDDPIKPEYDVIYNRAQADKSDSIAQKQATDYKRQLSYFMYGYVLEADKHPEWVGKFYRFNCKPQVFKKIKEGVDDPEMEHNPHNLFCGTNFKIKVGMNGQYPDYSLSKYLRKESELPENLIADLQTRDLKELKEYIYKKPTAEELTLIRLIFEASINGMPFKAEWAKVYCPLGYKLNEQGFLEPRTPAMNGNAPVETVAQPTNTVVESAVNSTYSYEEDDIPPFDTTPAPSPAPVQTKASAMEGLAKLQAQVKAEEPVAQATTANAFESLRTATQKMSAKTEETPKQESIPVTTTNNVPAGALSLSDIMASLQKKN